MSSPVWSALRSVLGWTLVILATAVTGLWFGLAIRGGEYVPPDIALGLFVTCLLAWLLFPQLLLAWGVSIISWIALVLTESRKWKAIAATANFLAWFSMPFWVLR